MNKPNLFSYAPRELSQDAFICWLIEWAKPENKKQDSTLHVVGTFFIDSMLAKHEKDREPYTSIDIRKPYGDKKDRLDVLVIINNKYALLIEDKTNTKNHSNQLKRYINKVEKDFPTLDIVAIYFKTGDQSHYRHVEADGFEVYGRKDLLKLFESHPCDNEILNDYQQYLLGIEKTINSYKSIPLNKKWTASTWKGFYMALKDQGVTGNWDYVPNQNNGFMGFWGYEKSIDTIGLKIQLEEKDLCFKIRVSDKAKQTICRNQLYHKVIKYHSESKSSLVVVKPKRFGKGQFMTVAKIKNYRVSNKHGYIDMVETINHIRKVERFIDGLALVSCDSGD